MSQLFSFFLLCLAASCAVIESTNVRQPRSSDIDLGPDGNYQCEGNGAYPHPDFCWLYYNCWEDVTPHMWQCRSNYLFDLRYNGCNFPDQTDCGNRLREPFTCPEANGVYPISPNVCEQRYITCVDYNYYLQTCPGDSIFDPNTKTCTPPATASCKPATTTTTVAPPPPGDFTCPQPNGLFADPESCSYFYQCNEGVAYRKSCPPGLVFNPTNEWCDWPFNVPGCNAL